METSRPVVVKRMPERLNAPAAKKFLNEVGPFLRSDRPQLVFDLSQVKQMDAAGVDMLLHCLNETMKRDGDVKLASLSPQAAVVLEMTRTERLFEVYQNSTDAVRSYSSFLPNAIKHSYAHSYASFAPSAPLPFPMANVQLPLDGVGGDGNEQAA
jgi:anti-sigma B factor antagonist